MLVWYGASVLGYGCESVCVLVCHSARTLWVPRCWDSGCQGASALGCPDARVVIFLFLTIFCHHLLVLCSFMASHHFTKDVWLSRPSFDQKHVERMILSLSSCFSSVIMFSRVLVCCFGFRSCRIQKIILRSS